MSNIIKRLNAEGWFFEYRPGTDYVEARHESGDRFPICRMSRRAGGALNFSDNARDQIGELIAELLDDYGKAGK